MSQIATYMSGFFFGEPPWVQIQEGIIQAFVSLVIVISIYRPTRQIAHAGRKNDGIQADITVFHDDISDYQRLPSSCSPIRYGKGC